MDGLPSTLMPYPFRDAVSDLETWPTPPMQRTLKAPISCVGVGLHSGRRIALRLLPAGPGIGIVFRRSDIAPDHDIAARHDNVVDTKLCTVLAAPDRPELRVSTVEHLMAAFVGCGIHNAIVLVDGPEIPVLDGSAAPLMFLLDCAGTVEQDSPVSVVEVLRAVRVTQGEAFAELRPSLAAGFSADLSIAFDAPAIGCQSISIDVTPGSFRAELARARTFTQAAEVAQLQSLGLALGGSLDNAVVVDGARVLNPGGLRMADEFVRHKLLDAVGDLALAGAALRGRLVAHRTGHALNNRLLRALFADAANWRLAGTVTPTVTGAAPMAGWRDRRVAIAAAPM